MSLTVNWFVPVRHRDFNRMAASIWIRCLQLLPYLEARDILCRVNEPGDEVDINIFVRWQDERAFELAEHWKKRGQKIVFDLVVNYFEPTSVPHLGKVVTTRHREEVLRMLSVADAVTCCSAHIAGRARQFQPAAEYVPDSIDARHFCRRKAAVDFSREPLRAVWSGVSIQARDLEPILPLLAQRGIELVVISDRDRRLRLPGRLWRRTFPHRFIRWAYGAFPEQILEGELCVAHRIVDNPYQQGHSLFKIGVFMSQGVPAIASPVPSYREILTGGTGGQLCHSLSDWQQTLDRIIDDRSILLGWSRDAERSMRPYLTASVVDRYLALFRALCPYWREPDRPAPES